MALLSLRFIGRQGVTSGAALGALYPASLSQSSPRGAVTGCDLSHLVTLSRLTTTTKEQTNDQRR